MNEALTLFATLVSAIAAAVGTAVSVAQWRRSGASRAPESAPALPRTGSPVERRPAKPATARRLLPRTTTTAVILGAATAGFATLGEVCYLAQQAGNHGTALEFLVGVALTGGILGGVVGAALALVVVVAGVVKRSGRSVRLGVLAFALSTTIWLSLWLAEVISDAGLE